MYSSELSNLPLIAGRRVFSGMGSERSFFTTSETYTVQSRMVAQISDIQYGFVLEYKKVLKFDNFVQMIFGANSFTASKGMQRKLLVVSRCSL